MNMTKFDPNAPAFGENVQRLDAEGNIIENEKPVETSVEVPAEEVKEEPVKEEVVEDSVEEENKVPYSRFKKFHDAAKEAEKEAEYWRREAESLKSQRKEVEETGELPDEWKELHGDSEASKKAWSLQQKLFEQKFKEAKESAIEAVKSERIQEEKRLNENVSELDTRMERLGEYLGRPLTEKEEADVLDIIDEFTPKDDDGNYLGAILPEEKAWEIHEMRQSRSSAPRKQSRDNVASMTGSKTHGETNVGPDKNKDFNPMWGAVSESVKKYGL